MNIEAELRHAVIDRLIAASLRDVVPAREASLQHWRAIRTAPTPVPPAGLTPAAPVGLS